MLSELNSTWSMFKFIIYINIIPANVIISIVFQSFWSDTKNNQKYFISVVFYFSVTPGLKIIFFLSLQIYTILFDRTQCAYISITMAGKHKILASSMVFIFDGNSEHVAHA